MPKALITCLLDVGFRVNYAIVSVLINAEAEGKAFI